MNIAIVHSFYGAAAPSGENEAVRLQSEALERAGHKVRLIAVNTDDQSSGLTYKMSSAASVATGRGRSPLRRLTEAAPDLVHVHNLFPNFGRTWAHQWPGPLVATLHNFRPLCAAATLYRNGASCTSCLDGDRWAGLRHRCYRDSYLATAPLAWAGRHGPTRDPLLSRADRLVLLSELSRDIYVRAGVNAERTSLIPNFVPDGLSSQAPGRGWVFVGRLSPEKGALELMRKWPQKQKLDVIGDGPLNAACQAEAPPIVNFLGSLTNDEVRKRLPDYAGIIFPSRCIEGATPLVYVESLAAGLPVLAFHDSAVSRAVNENGTGKVTSWNDPLDEVLAQCSMTFPSLRRRCRESYKQLYGEDVWSRRMTDLYRDVISRQA